MKPPSEASTPMFSRHNLPLRKVFPSWKVFARHSQGTNTQWQLLEGVDPMPLTPGSASGSMWTAPTSKHDSDTEEKHDRTVLVSRLEHAWPSVRTHGTLWRDWQNFYKTKKNKQTKYTTIELSFQHGLLANVNKPLDWHGRLDHLKQY